MKSALTLICITIFFNGCASFTSKKVHSEDVTQSSREFIFPRGNYQHRVELSIPATDTLPVRHYRFNGVVSLKPDSVQIVALSPFGTTVFKITENLNTHEIQDEIYLAQMKPLEPKLLQYYAFMRELLILRNNPSGNKTLKWTKIDSLGLPLQIDSNNGTDQATFLFKKYDIHGVPEQIEIQNPHFNVAVEVTAYEI